MEFLKQLFRRGPDKVNIEHRFQLLGRVGQGSMSKVWRAVDNATGRTVALKVLDPAKLARLEQRFVGLHKPKEGQIAVVLNHPHIVRTLEHGITTEREEYLVMEFIEGVGLGYLVEVQNERMRENCLFYCIQLGEAINYLHVNEWIHRDLCPRNVLVTDEDVIKLIDFGLMVPNTEDFRKPGNRTGTANYMAPELIKRQPTDQRIPYSGEQLDRVRAARAGCPMLSHGWRYYRQHLRLRGWRRSRYRGRGDRPSPGAVPAGHQSAHAGAAHAPAGAWRGGHRRAARGSSGCA
jgi:eukaryotic-like serine/threonine-protein kinase